MLDKYTRLPYNYQSKIGYNTLIQTDILKELIKIMGTTITNIDIELKMKISRDENLESENILLQMEECNICLTKIKKRNKNKHEQSKKHKYFSNLIINESIIKINEFYSLKDIIQPYYNNHKKNFDNFSVCVMWKKNDMLKNNISVPCTITFQKTHMFKPSMVELPIFVRVSSLDFLDTFDRNCTNDELDEVNIIFISDLKDLTLSHYIDQPRSMLCGKLERNFIEEDFRDFDYN